MIPEHMMEAIKRYVDHGIEPGSFLASVICNDLAGAFMNADHINKEIIGEYVQHFYNDEPSACWGSPARMEEWISHKNST